MLILMMIGYNYRTGTQNVVEHVSREKYSDLPPIWPFTRCKIEKQFLENGELRKTNNRCFSVSTICVIMNLLPSVQENRDVTAKKIARELVISQSVTRILETQELHPWEMKMFQELTECDPDRRLQFLRTNDRPKSCKRRKRPIFHRIEFNVKLWGDSSKLSLLGGQQPSLDEERPYATSRKCQILLLAID